LPDELALEVSRDADELPTDVDAALEAEEVLSAQADTLHKPRPKASVQAQGIEVFRKDGMGIPR
jgi:hypothetical protein